MVVDFKDATVAKLPDDKLDKVRQLEQELSRATGKQISLIAYTLEK